jgi:hypothetical protein
LIVKAAKKVDQRSGWIYRLFANARALVAAENGYERYGLMYLLRMVRLEGRRRNCEGCMAGVVLREVGDGVVSI